MSKSFGFGGLSALVGPTIAEHHRHADRPRRVGPRTRRPRPPVDLRARLGLALVEAGLGLMTRSRRRALGATAMGSS